MTRNHPRTEIEMQVMWNRLISVVEEQARTLVRTLKRLGYEIAVVSGGFTQVLAPLVAELGIDSLAANVLENFNSSSARFISANSVSSFAL